MKIRKEQPRDMDAIYHVTAAAFETMPFSDQSEPERVNQLRADGDLSLSLVAEVDGQIVGHIAFSPVFSEWRTGRLVWPWPGLGYPRNAEKRHWQGTDRNRSGHDQGRRRERLRVDR